MDRTAWNKTKVISEIPNTINEGNLITAPGQRQTPVSFLSDKFCEEQTFPYLLRRGKSGYNAPQDILISPALYFNQTLVNFNHYFPLDANYLLLPGLCMTSINQVYFTELSQRNTSIQEAVSIWCTGYG